MPGNDIQWWPPHAQAGLTHFCQKPAQDARETGAKREEIHLPSGFSKQWETLISSKNKLPFTVAPIQPQTLMGYLLNAKARFQKLSHGCLMVVVGW